MSQHAIPSALLLVFLAVSAVLADPCAKYKEFQDAWEKLRDPVAAGLSLDAQKQLQLLYDPRRLNTADIRNCTATEAPPNQQQSVNIQSWPTNGYSYGNVLARSLYFYEAQRSGALAAKCPVTNDFLVTTLTCTRPAWRGNSAMGDADGKDLTGGYYDAGDHVKFGLPAATAMAQLALGLIEFRQGYQAVNLWDRGLQTLRWALDYMVKAHSVSGDPSVLVAQVGNGDTDHAYWGRAEDMNMARPAYYINSGAPGTDLWAATAAALAGGAALYKTRNPTLSNTYLTHAQQLFNVAKTAAKGRYSQAVPNAASFYSSSGWADDLALAAAMLYVANPTPEALNEAKSLYDQWVSSGAGWESWDWDNAQWGATYILQKHDPGHTNSRNKLEWFVNQWLNKARTPKGLAYMTQWASLRGPVNAAFMFAMYAKAPANANNGQRQAQLSCWAQTQLRYALGDSGRSYVVGFGNSPPQQSHHRGASCPNAPASCTWDQFNANSPNPQILHGALIGGPDQFDAYNDRRSNFVQNEVAIDYNAGFTGALAAMVERRAAWATTCQCMCTGSNSCSAGGGACAINWVVPSPASPAPPTPSPKPGSPRPPSPRPPSPSPKRVSPSLPSPSPRPPSPTPNGGCNTNPTIIRAPWAQCGGKGGECPACNQGQCNAGTCGTQDSVWTNVGCANTPWGTRMGCCRENEWYWQCKELTNGQCPNNGPLCRLSVARTAAQEVTPYVTEAEARQRSARARAQAIKERQEWEAAQSGTANKSG